MSKPRKWPTLIESVEWDRSQRILAVGDIHFPFQHEAANKKLFDLVEHFKPTIVVQMGDLYDFFSQSRFPSARIITPGDEVSHGRKMAENFWKYMRSTCSRKTQLHQILGNHCVRPMKRLIEKAPELLPFFNQMDLFRFPGVQTTDDDSMELELAGICFMHGYRKFGTHVSYNLMPTVCGHSHLGGVQYLNIRGRVIWELNAGYLADPAQTPLMYRQQRWNKWTLGCGLIDHLGPRFVPF